MSIRRQTERQRGKGEKERDRDRLLTERGEKQSRVGRLEDSRAFLLSFSIQNWMKKKKKKKDKEGDREREEDNNNNNNDNKEE